MRLYLDTSSAVELIERKRTKATPKEFNDFLTKNQHTLVYSFPLVNELIIPMWRVDSDTVVTRTLNVLEDFPHEWIDIVGLPNREVQIALRCFVAEQHYSGCDPYVSSVVQTIAGGPPQGIKHALHYPLAETAFDLRHSGTFDPVAQRTRHTQMYRELMRQERELSERLGDKKQARRQLFTDRVVQRIQRERLYETDIPDDSGLFCKVAEHVADRPNWCPATRLMFEVFHSLVDNVGDKLEDSDLMDMAHVQALPYVDFLCTDRRAADYVERASRATSIPYYRKLRRTPDDLLRI